MLSTISTATLRNILIVVILTALGAYASIYFLFKGKADGSEKSVPKELFKDSERQSPQFETVEEVTTIRLTTQKHKQTTTTHLTTTVEAADIERESINASDKNVIVYLMKDVLMHRSICASSLAKLFKNYNSKYRHKVIIFHEPSLNATAFKAELERNAYFLKHPNLLSLVKFVEVNLTLPEGFNPTKEEIGMFVQNNSFPGYNNMIRFWFHLIFHEPIMRDVEYFWRLDYDSLLNSPIKYDLFEVMSKKQAVYGYRNISADFQQVTRGLWPFVREFMRNHSDLVFENGTQLGHFKDDDHVPSFYNNFEVVHVPTFRNHPGVTRFTESVEKSLNIFKYRWGDAPLRYLTVNLFFNVTNQTDYFCDVPYYHQREYKPTC